MEQVESMVHFDLLGSLSFNLISLFLFSGVGSQTNEYEKYSEAMMDLLNRLTFRLMAES
jgi:hypothetical protein